MSLIVLDINSDRIWGVSGAAHHLPRVVPFAGERADLLMAISMEGRKLQIGQAGFALSRKSPHLCCMRFLPRLGSNCEWHQGRHRLTPPIALSNIFQHVQKQLPSNDNVFLVVPSYLSNEQIYELAQLGQKSGLEIHGAITRELAAAIHSYSEQAWHHTGVFIDVDDHALTISILRPQDDEMQSLGQRILPDYSLRRWKEQLLNRIAEYCIRHSRRDPRELPEADQLLYEQLDHVLDGCSSAKAVKLQIQALEWFQSFTYHAEDAVAACTLLARQVAQEIYAAIKYAERQMAEVTVYLSAGAARLPGLAAAVYQRCNSRLPVVMLSSSASVLGAFYLLSRISLGELTAGLFAPTAPLPLLESGESPEVVPFPHPRKAEGE